MRVKSRGVYCLRRVTATRPPAAPGQLPVVEVEGVPRGIPCSKVSDDDPFGNDDTYEQTGRSELLAYQAQLAGEGRPPGVPVHEAAQAAWRRKVALSWAARLEEFTATLGLK